MIIGRYGNDEGKKRVKVKRDLESEGDCRSSKAELTNECYNSHFLLYFKGLLFDHAFSKSVDSRGM